MKENAYLLNCRNAIVRALQANVDVDNRPDLIQALTELDAYRHGQLQRCDLMRRYSGQGREHANAALFRRGVR